MTNYLDWIKSLEGIPIFVAQPVSFDYRFISWYLWEFTGEDPFINMNAPQTIDINTYYMALMDTNITQAMAFAVAVPKKDKVMANHAQWLGCPGCQFRTTSHDIPHVDQHIRSPNRWTRIHNTWLTLK